MAGDGLGLARGAFGVVRDGLRVEQQGLGIARRLRWVEKHSTGNNFNGLAMENYVLVSVRTRLGSLRIVKEVARVGRVTPLRAIPKVREMRGGILPVGDEVRRLIFIPNIANGWKLPTLSQEQLPALSRGAATGFVFLILGNRKSSIDTLRDESEAGRSVNLTKGNHHGSGSN